MSAFNMLNRVPYNVTVPEFQPERRSPIFPQITRKYPCIENIAGLTFGDSRARSRLSWKIQQPDPTLVYTGVKLVLPLRMQSYTIGDADPLDMRVTSRKPSANIALAETPMMAFRQTSLSLNGRIFSEDNSFRRVLDCCYRGSSPAAYGDNHSLKPVVIRNMDNDNSRQVTLVKDSTTGALMRDNTGHTMEIRTNFIAGKTLDAAFSLLEHNGPFLERARKFQDNLSEDGKTWEDDVTSYLEVGPFQARARKGNTAVPYIRDMHLMLNFIGSESKLDRSLGTELNHASSVPMRALPVRLFEFGTPSNLRHPGERINALLGWIGYMNCTWREKPYLEITYTKYIETMKPSYALRCYDRQYEKSNEFTLVPTGHGSNTKRARVTSRLLSMPTKVYVYGELTDVEKGAWGNGGVRRSCRLDNLHCRINQRPNVVSNPSQEDCYEMFQRHTNSSLEYASWLKSPIYVFTPVDLAQPDMFANDARRTIFEWDADVSMTELQGQEEFDIIRPSYAGAVGYEADSTYSRIFQQGAGYTVIGRWDYQRVTSLVTRDNYYQIQWMQRLTADPVERVLCYTGKVDNDEVLFAESLENKLVKWAADDGGQGPAVSEDAQMLTPRRNFYGADGLIWAMIKIDADGDAGTEGSVRNGHFFYVPHTFDFINYDTPDRRDQVNAWSRVISYTEGADDEKGDPIVTAKVDLSGIKWWRGAIDGNENRVMNPEIDGGVPPQGPVATWGAAAPGPFAYLCDRQGLRNRTAGTAAYLWGGPLAPGDGPYVAVDQRSDPYRWACFTLSDGMVNETGPDKNFVCNRGAQAPGSVPNKKIGVADDMFVIGGMGFNHSNVAGYGAVTMRTVFEVDRGVRFRKNVGTYNMGESTVHSWGQPLALEITDPDTILQNKERGYQLKVLYEYGNAQYQFSADGMPTRVLPNLVPVGPSAGFPEIR